MKRKFGFSLAPLKIPSKADHDALRRALDGDFSPVSSPDSPFVDRQHISRSVEHDLRQACKLLVERTGNAHHNSNEDALVNFSSLQRAAAHKISNTKSTKQASKSEVSLPILKMGSSMSTKRPGNGTARKTGDKSPEKPKDSLKNEKKSGENGESTKSSNRPHFPVREDSLSNGKQSQFKKRPTNEDELIPPPSITAIIERPRTAPADSSDESCDSPMSASTDRALQSVSTALTSVAITPAKISFKPSQPSPLDPKTYQEAVAKADRKAAEMLRQQSEAAKEENTKSSNNQPASSEKGFASGFRDFVRNRSRSRSRSREPSGLTRNGSTLQNWRSGWGLRRKQSASSLIDMTEGASKIPEQDEKDSREVDLNRALPPLPSLDTYKEENTKEGENMSSATNAITNETVIHIANVARPKTSGGMSTSSQAMSIEPFPRPARQRSSSVKARRKPSVTVDTAISVPVRKFSIAESKASSQDSCFSPAGTDFDTPKRSMDVMKAAAIARTQSIENLREQSQPQQQLRRDTVSAAQKSSTTSWHPSRPPSRGGAKSATTPKYSIIPHQRTPSQPILYSRSAGSSLVNLPARPATRDASSLPSRSRLPSVSCQSTASGYPPLPVNFSRKIANEADGGSHHTTSAGQKSKPGTEITALPQVPPKKGSGLRRMLSSLSIRKPKGREMPWLQREGAKSSAGILAA